MGMARAYRTSQLVYVAAKLRIADLLADGPKSCREIAVSLGASEDAVCRVMRGLAGLGLFEPFDEDRFTLTALSVPLLDVPGSVRSGVIYVGEEQYRAWGDLLQTVMTGQPAFPRLFGDPFSYYDEHPEAGESFDDWMTASSMQVAAGISHSYEFPDSGVVVDIAGGKGALLSAILNSRPHLRGILLERQSVIEKARRFLEAEGTLERCRLVPGDFRLTVSRGGDIYILRNVLHDWDDFGALQILKATRRAMKPGSRLLVIQRTMPDASLGNPPRIGMVEADLMQLVYSGGRERTDAEFRSLLMAASFTITNVMKSGGQTWLIEASISARNASGA